MANEAFVQVATDGSGKKVSMDQGVDPYGNTIYRQNANLIGDAPDLLSQILAMDRQILGCLRAILRVMADTSNARTTEEDYSSSPGVNFDG